MRNTGAGHAGGGTSVSRPPVHELLPVDPSEVPSLGVVEDAVSRQEASYRDRAGGVDTKAGVLLSAAGVIVVLVGAEPATAGLVGQCLAVAAGAAAVAAFLPRVDKSISPARLRDRYLAVDPVRVRLILLNTRIDLITADENRLIRKLRWLKVASLLLLLATVAVVVGGMVNMF